MSRQHQRHHQQHHHLPLHRIRRVAPKQAAADNDNDNYIAKITL